MRRMPDFLMQFMQMVIRIERRNVWIENEIGSRIPIICCSFADISRIKRAVDGDELLNPRVLGNMVEEAEPFKCDTVKCGHDVNNAIGMMFSQMIAHDTTRRMVVEQKGW